MGLFLASPPFLPPTHLYLHQTFPASTFWPLLSLLTSHTILASHSFSFSAFLIGLPPFLSLHFSFWVFSLWFSLRPAQNIQTPWRLWICKVPFQTTTFHLNMSIHIFSTPQLIRNNPCPSWHLAVRTTWVYAQGNLVVLSVIPILLGLPQHSTVVSMEV